MHSVFSSLCSSCQRKNSDLSFPGLPAPGAPGRSAQRTINKYLLSALDKRNGFWITYPLTKILQVAGSLTNRSYTASELQGLEAFLSLSPQCSGGLDGWMGWNHMVECHGVNGCRGSWQGTFLFNSCHVLATEQGDYLHYFTCSAQQPPEGEVVPCFPGEGAKAQREEVTCLRSHR